MTFGTWRWWGCQPHSPAAFTPRKCSWYSFSLGAGTVGRNMSLKNQVTPPGIDPGTIRLVAQRLNHYAISGLSSFVPVEVKFAPSGQSSMSTHSDSLIKVWHCPRYSKCFLIFIDRSAPKIICRWPSEFSQEMSCLSTCRLNIRKTFCRPVSLSHTSASGIFYSIMQLNKISNNSKSVAASKPKLSISAVLTAAAIPSPSNSCILSLATLCEFHCLCVFVWIFLFVLPHFLICRYVLRLYLQEF